MEEDDWLRLSLLQHFAYCPRQASLILEGVWEDNRLTVEGQASHVRVDHGPTDHRRGVTVHHSVEVSSSRHKLYGVADSVEESTAGALCPVEHKHGRGAGDLLPSTVHVVAQAICLEEVTQRSVTDAAVFIVSERRRVPIDVPAHRAEVEIVIKRARSALLSGVPVEPVLARQKCRSCSIRVACQPDGAWWP